MIATGPDHTPVAPGEDRKFGEELGPARAARAMAIVHIAMFNAYNTIAGGYHNYLAHPAVPKWTSAPAAIAQGAHDILAWLRT